MKMSLINGDTDRYQPTGDPDFLPRLQASSQLRTRLPAEITALST